MDKLKKASSMAGEWWANKLNDAYADKREAFSNCITEMVEATLITEGHCFLECDYDPRGILLTAVQKEINANCSGILFSAEGILPQKHALVVLPDRLEPKEGYGNWTSPILVEH